MIRQFVFSPTGGTASACAFLTEGLRRGDEEVQVLDLTDTECDFSRVEVSGDDVCVVAIPCFGGRVPQVALERMGLVAGNGCAAVALVSFGNRAIDDGLLELCDALAAAGFVCTAGVAAVTEHSLARQFGSGRPDETDAESLRACGARIAKKIEAGVTSIAAEIPGARPYKKFGGVPIAPHARKGACTGCGACARSCPVGAIDAQKPWETNADACISCMRCVKFCHAGARHVSGLKLFAVARKLAKVASGRKDNELFL